MNTQDLMYWIARRLYEPPLNDALMEPDMLTSYVTKEPTTIIARFQSGDTFQITVTKL